MVAVVIDPIVCKSDWWWLIPECWGVVVMLGVGLGVAVASSVAYKTLVGRAARFLESL